jgi:hypothetical protein
LSYFDDCNTVEELNNRRTTLLAEMNKQYGDKRKEIVSQVLPYKPIVIYKMSSVPDPEIVVHCAFNVSEEAAPPNTIVFSASGSASI